LSGTYLRKISGYMLLMMSLMSCVWAQEMSEIPARLIIPDGTPVHLRLAESVSSAHARVGDLLDFIVVRDVCVGNFTIIQAGTMAQGSITGVKGRRLLGIGGKVSLQLDSVSLFNGDRVGLRAKKEVKGGSRTKLMVGGMIVASLIFLPATPVFLLTRGHTSTVLKSTEVTARIDGATSVLSAGLPRSQERSSELDELMDYLPPRIFNREGREGDMLNLAFAARSADLQEAFEHAGWVKTDKWGPVLVWHLLRHGRHDMTLPMARFYLFGRIQDYSYALPDPVAVVSRRHHIRIWKTGYMLDGTPLWIAAATHDVAIEIAKRGRLINHRIDPEVDAERDFIGVNMTEASSITGQQYLHGVAPVFEAQTSSGEAYHSDGRILLLNLRQIASARSGLPAQSSTVVGAASLPIAAPAESYQSNLTSPR
jgi:LssY C-terminus